MRKNEILQTLNCATPKYKVALYGAGEFGLKCKNYFTKNFNIFDIVCFIDTFKSGELDGIRIVNIRDFNNVKNKFDFVLITSHFHSDIETVLLKRQYKRFLVVPQPLVMPPTPVTVMPVATGKYEKFIYTNDSCSLTNDEYLLAKSIINKISLILKKRDDLLNGSNLDVIYLPSAGWDPGTFIFPDIDQENANYFNVFNLVFSGDMEIISKLRLYSWAFTGYQLATLGKNPHGVPIKKRLPQNHDEFLELLVCNPDEYVEAYIKIAENLPPKLHISLPQKFGEVGWLEDGKIVNYDTARYLDFIVSLYECDILTELEKRLQGVKPIKILEIGGGFGGLAYCLMEIFSYNVKYVVVDIPESLLFSSIYLSILFKSLENKIVFYENTDVLPKNKGISFLPNFYYKNMVLDNDEFFDLVINTESLAEMAKPQVLDYIESIKKYIKNNGYFFEVNSDSPYGFNFSELMHNNDFVLVKESKTKLHRSSRLSLARLWKNK